MSALESLRAAQETLARAGIAPTTRRARRSQANRYRKFCRKFKLNQFPCSSKQACLYATYLSQDLSPSSVRNYISGLWYKQQMLGFSAHSDCFDLKQTLNGIERSRDSRDKLERYPLSPEEMLDMYNILDLNNHDDFLFWLTALLCYRGLLRVCHTTHSKHNITAQDVSFGGGFLKVKICSSKTDQFGRNQYCIFLQDIPESPWCVAPLISRLLVGAKGSDPLLSHKLGGLVFPQSYDMVNSRLKRCARELGWPVSRVSTHSFRHGGTSMLQDLGLPVTSIMRKGNWRSSVVKRYLHQSTKELALLEQVPCDYFNSLM